MDTYVPISEGARLLNQSMEHLNQLIGDNIIKAAKTSGGGIIVCQEDILSMLPIEDRPEYQEFKTLKGETIGIREASRAYDIPNPTISRWVKKGYIKVLDEGGKGKEKLLDKSYVAFWAKIYHQNPGQGRWTVKKAKRITD